MPESHAARGTRRGRRTLVTLGDELRAARLSAGLSLASVAHASGTSVAELSRIERAAAPWATIVVVSRIAAVVGLDVWVRSYPGPTPLRDTAHANLFSAFRAAVHRSLVISAEVPIAGDRDMRAWDAVVQAPGGSVGVELETRLTDVQGLLRRINLKARDAGLDRVVLVFADTRANRRAFRVGHDQFAAVMPLRSRIVLQALRAGVLPTASGVAFVRLGPRTAGPILAPREVRSGEASNVSERAARRESATIGGR